LSYTLDAAIASICEYKGLHAEAYDLALMKLYDANNKGSSALRSEAARIREAFYVYERGFDYGRP
jgi:hypothetical protein